MHNAMEIGQNHQLETRCYWAEAAQAEMAEGDQVFTEKPGY